MGHLSTHVLDTARGKPAEGITVVLEYWENGEIDRIGVDVGVRILRDVRRRVQRHHVDDGRFRDLSGRRVGGPLGYFASFRVPPAGASPRAGRGW